MTRSIADALAYTFENDDALKALFGGAVDTSINWPQTEKEKPLNSTTKRGYIVYNEGTEDSDESKGTAREIVLPDTTWLFSVIAISDNLLDDIKRRIQEIIQETACIETPTRECRGIVYGGSLPGEESFRAKRNFPARMIAVRLSGIKRKTLLNFKTITIES